ncbi:outer membrane lipoprotein carrier protein LolA [Streptomyces sp. NPDC007088]|uniref:LolA family protein n=1 Tax=Streptomyces sp. NPDC007088 TaxID=3364773 RepID=UPI003680D98F
MEPYASDSGSTSGPENESTTRTGAGPGSGDRTRPVRRRKAARYAVPAAVAGVAALTVGLVPALADSGDPDLPAVTARELVEKIASADTDQLSGTFKISTDLGLPGLGGLGGGAPVVPGGSGSGSSPADPRAKLAGLASGTHTLRIAVDGPERQKLSLLEDAAEYSLVHNGDEAWAYDSGSNQAVRLAVPEHGAGQRGGSADEHAGGLPKGLPTTPEELAEQTLKAVDDTTSVSVDGTARVAGRDTYQLLVRPRQSGSTIESARIAVDAKTGTPLRFTLNAVGGGKPVVNAGFTKVDFAKPAASAFDFSPPKGAKVTEGDSLGAPAPGKRAPGNEAGPEGVKVIGKGWGAIAELSLPGGQGLPDSGSGEVPPEAGQLLDSLGKQVKGSFGTGTVFSTRLVNALITDDGKVYAGAVDKDALVRAAESAK